MKLRTRLLVGVSIYQLLLAAVGLIGFLSAQTSLGGMEVAVGHHIAELNTLGQLASEVDNIHSLALLHGLAESPVQQAAYETTIRRSEAQAAVLTGELLDIQERFGDESDAEQIRDFQGSWTAYLHLQDDQLLALTGPDHDDEIDALTGPDGPLVGPYTQATSKLVAIQSRAARSSIERLNQTRDDFLRNRNLLLAASIVAAGLGFGFGLHQSARLARAVEAVSQAARRVAAGDLSQRLRIRTGDEIESLAISFNTMTNNLEAMTARQAAHLSELETSNRALRTEVSERQRAELALRDSEARFRSVTESVKEAIVSADGDGRITFWNRGAQRMFGYREAEALGMPFARLVAPDGRPDADARPGVERWVGQTTELDGVRKSKKPVPIELSVTRWQAGRKLFYTATLRDITDRRAMDRLKNEFVSMVSHELRTPMNGVIGMVDLLLRTELSPRQRIYATALEHSGQSLLGIIDDIVDFSKIEAGKFELELGDVDLRDLVEGAAGVLAEQAASKGLELACLIDQDVPRLLGGDPRRVRQVLLNLIGNAVKFTDAGDVVVRVRVQRQTPELAVVRFDVTDTGIGIPREVRKRLFQPFVQVHDDRSRRHGGTGLGLAISRRLVELMGGAVGVDAGPRRGSTFWFSVPFAARSEAGATPPGDGPLRGLRVLVVDDNPTARAAIQQQLGDWGAASTAAQGASEALLQLQAAAEADAPYGAVLVDLHLPHREAHALALALKTDPQLRATRVVALTSLATSESDVPRDFGRAVIEKPVRRARLLEVLTGAASAPSPTPEDRRDSPRAMASPTVGARVLVIEDLPVNQLAASSMLAELGYEAEVVANGRDGLACLERRSYAAVLMDCQMPDLDGYQTTAEIRRREDGSRRTPIIAMTASAMLGDRERCLAAGMDDYLSKPVRLSALAAALERWVQPTEVPAPAVDPTALGELKRLGGAGEPDVVAEMVRLFRENALDRLADLRAALAAGDAEAVRFAAHGLRSTSMTVGACEISQLSEQIEAFAQSGQLAQAGALVSSALPGAIEHASATLHALVHGEAGEAGTPCAS